MRPINADALKEELGIAEDCDDCERLGEHGCVNSTWAIVCDRIESAPTIDAVPVVRCKDCRWYVRSMIKQDGTLDERYKPDWCDLYRRVREETYFCADGERKDDDKQ